MPQGRRRDPRGGNTAGLKPPGDFGRIKGGSPSDTEQHASEVRAVARGRDIVEKPANAEQRPPQFDREELMVVRSWLDRRPLEPKAPPTAMIQYPRSWNTKRGRYCKFKAPGTGIYGLLRARPTF